MSLLLLYGLDIKFKVFASSPDMSFVLAYRQLTACCVSTWKNADALFSNEHSLLSVNPTF